MKNKRHNIFYKSLKISLYMFTFLFRKFPSSTLCLLLASGSGISSTHGHGICRHWSVSVVSLVSLGTHLPKFFALLCSVAIDKKFQSQHHTKILKKQGNMLDYRLNVFEDSRHRKWKCNCYIIYIALKAFRNLLRIKQRVVKTCMLMGIRFIFIVGLISNPYKSDWGRL